MRATVFFTSIALSFLFTACAEKDRGRCDFKMVRLGTDGSTSSINDFQTESLTATECGQKCMDKEIENCNGDTSIAFFRSNCDLTLSSKNYIKNVNYPRGLSSGQKPCSTVLGR